MTQTFQNKSRDTLDNMPRMRPRLYKPAKAKDESDPNFVKNARQFIKNSKAMGATTYVENGQLRRKMPDSSLRRLSSQAEKYEKAMNRAQRGGGSNGIGVGP